MFKNKNLYIFKNLVVLLVIIILIVICITTFNYYKPFILEGYVVGKGVMITGSKIEYFIDIKNSLKEQDKSSMLLNVDNYINNKYDSDKIYNYLELDKKYKFTVYYLPNGDKNILIAEIK